MQVDNEPLQSIPGTEDDAPSTASPIELSEKIDSVENQSIVSLDDIAMEKNPELYQPNNRDKNGFIDRTTDTQGPIRRRFRMEEVIEATQELENPIYAIANMVTNRFKDDEDYVRYENLDGYEDYILKFRGVNSKEEEEYIKSKIDKEAELRSIVDESTGVQKLVGLGTMVATDPTTLIPFGGATKSAFKIGRVVEGVGKTAAVGFFTESGREAVLQADQVTRTTQESVINVAAATVLSGILGGASAALSTDQLSKLSAQFEKDITADIGGDAGAAVTKNFGATGGRETFEQLKKTTTLEGQELAGLKLTKKLLKKVPGFLSNPIIDGMLSPSLATRAATELLGDSSLVVQKNLAGKATNESVESAMKIYDMMNYKYQVSSAHSYKNYITRLGGGSKLDQIKLKVGGKANDGSTVMSRTEFNEAVSKHMRNGGSDIAEVKEAAKYADEYVFKPILEEAKAAGIFKDIDELDVKTAENWVKRIYDIDMIQTNRTEFEDTVVTWLKQERDIATQSIGKAEEQIDLLRGQVKSGKAEAKKVERITRKAATTRLAKELDSTPAQFDGVMLNDIVAKSSGKSADTIKEEATKRLVDKTLEKELGKAVDDIVRRTFIETSEVDINKLSKTLARDGSEITDEVLDDALAGGIRADPEFGEALRRSYDEIKAKVIKDVEEKISKKNFKDKAGKTLTTEQVIKKITSEAKREARASALREARKASKGLREAVIAQSQKLKKAIDDLDSFKRRSAREDIELQDIASDIADRITNSTNGRIPYDMKASGSGFKKEPGLRGSAKTRAFAIPDAMIEKFLVNDIDEIVHAHIKTMAPDIELLKRFETLNFDQVKKSVQEDYKKLTFQVRNDTKLKPKAREKKITKLQNQQKKDMKNLEGMWQKLRGTYKNPDDFGSAKHLFERGAMGLNFARLLGDVVASSVPDAARVVMINGFARSYGDLFKTLATDFKGLKMSIKEIKELGTTLDMVNSETVRRMASMDQNMPLTSNVDKAISKLSATGAKWSGINLHNSMMKTLAGISTQNRMLEAIEALATGKKIKPKERTYLAANFIDEDMAKRIQSQVSEVGEKRGPIRLANAKIWTDKEAREMFRSAVRKQVDQIIITPGLDRPLWLSEPGWRLIGQFKSFNFSSMQRTTLAGLQQGDARALGGLTQMVMLGSLVYAYKQKMAGREISDDPRVWITEGVDRSGVTGWLFDVNNTLEKVTRGQLGVNALIGGQPMSRYASHNVLGSLLGPTAGGVKDLTQFIGSVSTGDTNENDVRALKRLLPYMKIPWIRPLADKIEEYVNENVVK